MEPECLVYTELLGYLSDIYKKSHFTFFAELLIRLLDLFCAGTTVTSLGSLEDPAPPIVR